MRPAVSSTFRWCPTVPFGVSSAVGELGRARGALAEEHRRSCARSVVAERAELLRVLDDEDVVELVVGVTVDDSRNIREIPTIRKAE